MFSLQFSKSIVFDAYSAFVNNFSVAMETAKKQARSKQAFADFLKVLQYIFRFFFAFSVLILYFMSLYMYTGTRRFHKI